MFGNIDSQILLGQVAYVTFAGDDSVVFSNEFLNGFSFRRRLNDDQIFAHTIYIILH